MRRGVKVIGKCCKELVSDSDKSSAIQRAVKETAEPDANVSSILPAYFWDTKSMIW